VIRANPKVSNGTSFVKNLFKDIKAGTVASSAINFGTEYVAKYGNLVAGDKFFVSVSVVMPNGQAGVPQTFVCVATA